MQNAQLDRTHPNKQYVYQISKWLSILPYHQSQCHNNNFSSDVFKVLKKKRKYVTGTDYWFDIYVWFTHIHILENTTNICLIGNSNILCWTSALQKVSINKNERSLCCVHSRYVSRSPNSAKSCVNITDINIRLSFYCSRFNYLRFIASFLERRNASRLLQLFDMRK